MMVAAGENCHAFLEETLVDLAVDDLECDEVWGFVGMKEKTRTRKQASEEYGDCYIFTAIERTSKLLVAWHVGKRCPQDTRLFAGKLNAATSGRFQLSSDGYTPYKTAIPAALGNRITYGQIVKVYGTPQEGQKRYSPAMIIERTHEDRVSLGIGVCRNVFGIFPEYWFADVVANDTAS